MGKKKKEMLDAEFVPFSDGMRANGYSDQAIKALWDVLVPFSDYAFNKAHTAAYGLISYWTAYLKAHYPAEYMAALLTSVKDDKDKMAIYLNECRRMKIQVLPPDVNESASNFTPVGNDIRFGLTAIRNVGANVVAAIVDAREEKGRFTDFNDFMEKVPALVCNKRVIESLVKAGAFDDMKHRRRALVAIHETAVDQYVDIKSNEAIGQDSLFGGLDDEEAGIVGFGISVAIPDIDEWDKTTLLGHERDMLGLYVSDHPLLGLEHVLSNGTDCTIGQLLLDEERADGTHGHHQRPGHLGAAQDHQARRRLGDDHPRGPRRRDRRAALPQRLPAGQQLPHRGRDPHRQGPALAQQGAARAPRPGGHRPRPLRRAQRAGRDQPALDPVHRARGRAAQGRARHPPGPDRGPAAAADPQRDHADAPRRPAPGHAEPGALRRPQGAPGARMPQRMRSVLRQVAVVLLLFAVVGVLAGVVWQWVWSPPTGVAYQGSWVLDVEGLTHDFSGTGLYVVVGAVAGLLAGAAAGVLFDRDELVTLAAVVAGAALAAWLMKEVGQALGPPDPRPLAEAADDYTPHPQRPARGRAQRLHGAARRRAGRPDRRAARAEPAAPGPAPAPDAEPRPALRSTAGDRPGLTGSPVPSSHAARSGAGILPGPSRTGAAPPIAHTTRTSGGSRVQLRPARPARPRVPRRRRRPAAARPRPVSPAPAGAAPSSPAWPWSPSRVSAAPPGR